MTGFQYCTNVYNVNFTIWDQKNFLLLRTIKLAAAKGKSSAWHKKLQLGARYYFWVLPSAYETETETETETGTGTGTGTGSTGRSCYVKYIDLGTASS